MTVLLIDAETYSECDLRAAGARKYMDHPSTTATLWSIRDPAWDESLVFETDSLWDTLRALKKAGRIQWTRNHLLTLIHWGAFDRMLVQHADGNPEPGTWTDQGPGLAGILGPANTLWCDLREVSLTYGGPGNLKGASLFFGDGLERKSEGKHLIRKFAMPQADGSRLGPDDDPVRWEEFRAYARQDTNTMVPIYWRMTDLQGHDHVTHWPHLRVIGRMNERGVPVDVDAAKTAVVAMERLEAELVEEIEQEFGFRPSQVAKVAEFLGTENTQRETLENLLEIETDPAKIKVATARLVTAGAARKKLDPIISMAQDDSRIRGCFDYHGAWTRRLTSFGVQFQNMVRSRSDSGFFDSLTEKEWDTEIFDAVRQNIRGFVCAPEGQTLVAADYSQIELRVGLWLAGETGHLDLIRNGGDPYRVTAAKLFNVAPAEVTGEQRQFGKIVELGSIYQLGGRGLQKQAAGYGIDLNEGDAKYAVDVYRESHPAVVRTWGHLNAAFGELLRQPIGARAILCPGDEYWEPHAVLLPGQGPPPESIRVGAVCLERGDRYVRVVRPSGFAQYYWLPQLTMGAWPDGGEKIEIEFLRRSRRGQMERATTYGGDIFQGIVQGTAADLMLEGMLRAEAAGYPPIMSVHDEIVCEVPEPWSPEGVVDNLCSIICELPDWAEGLPVTAEGWVNRRFTK